MSDFFDLNILIILAALGGFLIALYIHRKKRTGDHHLVCPIGSDCDTVIHSPYSRFFGIPVELLGLLYYASIAISYGIFISTPLTTSLLFVFAVFVISLGAFLFSIYLTFIQIFNLKQLCTWCLISAGLTTIIFFAAIANSSLGFVEMLSEHRQLILILHLVGVALGIGGATISDIFFFRFLKDFRISESESELLGVLSQVIWFALGILVITGIGLFLPASERLVDSPKFLVKMVVVGVIIVNGTLLNLLIAPKLVRISFGRDHEHREGELHRERKLAFALGAVSFVSWYTALVLGILRGVTISFWHLLFLYLAILTMAIISSQIFERIFIKRSET